MKKILISLIFLLISNSTVYANSDDKPPSYEEMYSEWGYTSIDEALSEFETHFEKDLKLPLRVPPLAFTHQFGKFSDTGDEINDSFEVEFVSDQQPENHYKIDVSSAKNRINFTKRDVKDTYKLKDGTVASHISFSSHFYGLVFEKDNWQYILSVDKRVANTVTPEILIEIANSFESES